MANRAGEYKKQLSGEAAYQSFVPTPLQRVELNLDADFYALLTKTSRILGTLDGISSRVPDMDLFVSMYIRKEALLSSQIEGTQATLEDILDPEAETNQNLNVAEVLNYIKAFNFAIQRMDELPLCNRLLKETHAVLLSGLRGGEKNPGEFRQSQNWIGPAGSTIQTASYIPPAVDDMAPAISELEKYLNEEDDSVDPLIKIALTHYQFETIHPFLDGNGRIGRLLVTLFLRERKQLIQPVLYISYYLKRNRIEYYDRLAEVRRKGNFEQWVRFFIQAIHDTAGDAIEAIDRLSALRERNLAKIAGLKTAAKTARKVFAYIERSPIIEISKTSEEMGLSYNTVATAVRSLCELGILQQVESMKRSRCFAYEEYLSILRKDT